MKTITKTVAIQGIEGSFHDIAAHNIFENETIGIIPCLTFPEVFDAVKKDGTVYGLIAIENTVAGSLLPNYNLLMNSNLQIIGEYKLRIEQNLVVIPGQKIEDITEVYSHPVALQQCEVFFRQYPHIRLIESDDTAESAKNIALNKDYGKGAICSKLAAETYHMEILAAGIETNKRNFTRFLLLADPWNIKADHAIKDKADKSSLVFALPHESGSLSKVLTILSFYDINLTKIQSFPVLGQEWEYLFFIDLTFDDYVRYQQSLEAIKPLSRNLKILGEYTIGKQSFTDESNTTSK